MSPMEQVLERPADARARPRAVGWWLLSCCVVLLTLVMVGGATRLTESGLSIVDWKPVTGVLPPIGEAAWQTEFTRYQESPQYTDVNRGMALSEFKVIFWFALPLLWFWLRGAIPSRLRWPLLGILALGGAQGYLGWFMVQSGLVDVPRVSPYRLAAHLSLALVVYALMFRVALGLLLPRAKIEAKERPGAGLAQPARESGDGAIYSPHPRLDHVDGHLVGVVAHERNCPGSRPGSLAPRHCADGDDPGHAGNLHLVVDGAGLARHPAPGRRRAPAQRGDCRRLLLENAGNWITLIAGQV